MVALLDELAPITNAALLKKLQDFLIAGGEAWRKEAILSAIREVAGAVALRKQDSDRRTDTLCVTGHATLH